jgi:GlpG protein
MRQIGTIRSQSNADQFLDYLTIQGIAAQAEQDGQGEWVIWVRDENQVEEARRELRQYEDAPDAGRYHDARRQADAIRHEAAERQRRAQKNYVQVRDQWNLPLRKRAPITTVLIVACVALGVANYVSPTVGRTITAYLLFRDPLFSILSGQIWRLITPILLHGGPMHLLFNMLALHYLGGQVEPKLRSVRFGLMVLGIALCSNLTQYVAQGPGFVGISGVLFGLFGYIWIRMLRDPASGYMMSRQTITFVMGFFLLGWLGAFEGFGLRMANWAHGGGLAAGMALAYLQDFFAGRGRVA